MMHSLRDEILIERRHGRLYLLEARKAQGPYRVFCLSMARTRFTNAARAVRRVLGLIPGRPKPRT